MLLSAAVAALMTATPTTGASHADHAKAEANQVETKGKTPDFTEFLKIFDKIFPAQPDPDPDRLAVAQQSAKALFPDGTYGRLMTGLVDTVAMRVLNMSEADFETTTRKGKPASTETLHQSLLKDDPHFDERMAIIRRVIGEEMGKVTAILEPRMRDGLARSMARRFDARQLADLNAFLATDSGKAFGEQSMAMWIDPDIMRGMFGAMPELIAVVPGIAARIDKETAHLPKPKKAKPATEKKKAD